MAQLISTWPWTEMGSTSFSLSSEYIALNLHKLKVFLSAHPLSSCLFCLFACSCYGDDTLSWKAECSLPHCRWQESTSPPEGQDCWGVGTWGVQRIEVLEGGTVFPLETEDWFRSGWVWENRAEILYGGVRLVGEKGWRECGVTVLVGRGDLGRTRTGRAPSPGRCGHTWQDSGTCKQHCSGAENHLCCSSNISAETVQEEKADEQNWSHLQRSNWGMF